VQCADTRGGMDFLLPGIDAAADDLLTSVAPLAVRGEAKGVGTELRIASLAETAEGGRVLFGGDALKTRFRDSSAAPSRGSKRRKVHSASAGCLAGVFVLQLLGRATSLGGRGLLGRSQAFDGFSSADAAIDSCVALATSSNYGVQSARKMTPSAGRGRHTTLLIDAVKETKADDPGAGSSGMPRGYRAIVQRLGLLDIIHEGLVQLPRVSKVDQTDLLIDHAAWETLNDARFTSRCCDHVAESVCSHECLARVRETCAEAQNLFRSGRFEEARLWFQDATLRLAAYTNKTENNAGSSPLWGEGRRLNKEWTQAAVDAASGAGECCLKLQQYADAVIESTTVLVLEPDNLQALYTRGLAYKRMANEARQTSAISSTPVLSRSQRSSHRSRLLRQAWKVLGDLGRPWPAL